MANGVTAGTSATTFSPNDTCTRAQAVTLLYNAAGAPAVSDTVSFADVAADAYYADAAAWAAANGVTAGTSATTFSPNDTCTFAGREVFSQPHMSPGKMIGLSFAAPAAKGYEVFDKPAAPIANAMGAAFLCRQVFRLRLTPEALLRAACAAARARRCRT